MSMSQQHVGQDSDSDQPLLPDCELCHLLPILLCNFSRFPFFKGTVSLYIELNFSVLKKSNLHFLWDYSFFIFLLSSYEDI
jgi:hypothetical protein